MSVLNWSSMLFEEESAKKFIAQFKPKEDIFLCKTAFSDQLLLVLKERKLMDPYRAGGFAMSVNGDGKICNDDWGKEGVSIFIVKYKDFSYWGMEDAIHQKENEFRLRQFIDKAI
jgi:hypothetical protein